MQKDGKHQRTRISYSSIYIIPIYIYTPKQAEIVAFMKLHWQQKTHESYLCGCSIYSYHQLGWNFEYKTSRAPETVAIHKDSLPSHPHDFGAFSIFFFSAQQVATRARGSQPGGTESEGCLRTASSRGSKRRTTSVGSDRCEKPRRPGR